MAIIVDRQCGKRFKTGNANAGKVATCPNWRVPLVIPLPTPDVPPSMVPVAMLVHPLFSASPVAGRACCVPLQVWTGVRLGVSSGHRPLHVEVEGPLGRRPETRRPTIWSVGFDVHQRSSTLCILEEHDKRFKQQYVRGPWQKVIEALKQPGLPFGTRYQASRAYGALHDRSCKLARRGAIGVGGAYRRI